MNIPTTVRIESGLWSRTEKASREWARAERPSLGAYIQWCIRQAQELLFLTPENRAFINQLAREAGCCSWFGETATRLMVVNSLVDVARIEIAAARVELQLNLFQEPLSAKFFPPEESQ